ncbi:MAG: phosphotransferase [Candidatus Promineifilaceae bacterium]
MGSNLLAQLKEMDRVTLTEIVRKVQDCPDLSIVDWTVEPLTHEKVISTTGGLFRFSGLALHKQKELPWTVVLKCINNPKPRKQRPRGWSYWKREALAFMSGFLEQLPPGARAPHYYGAIERDDGVWLWIEYIQEATGQAWSLSDFRRTAQQWGFFQGAYLSGTPLIDYPWLSRSFFRDIWAEGGTWANIMSPETDRNAWLLPLVQQNFDDQQKTRVLQLIADKQRFFEANDTLPQVLCHNDAHRRNFMWLQSQTTGEEELIGIDWAFLGHGACGNDLGELVGTSLYLFDFDPYQAETLETAVFKGYLAGVSEHHLDIDERLIRLGYLISLSFWMGAAIPGWVAILMSPNARADVQAMCGRPKEDVLAGWVHLNEFCLDRADEARNLMRQLDL